MAVAAGSAQTDQRPRMLGETGLRVHPLCLGTNAFGWTADRDTSWGILDNFVDGGGNFVDTADIYSLWAPGHEGGESEAVIGGWIKNRGRRDDIVLSTKVGAMGGLGRQNIRDRVEASLKRLNVDHIELLYAHVDDYETPLIETLSAFEELVNEGKVAHIAASNYKTDRLVEAVSISEANGLPRFEVFSGHFNLIERKALMPASGERSFFEPFEPVVREVMQANRLAFVPYWVLAKGFLTGKYSPAADDQSFSARTEHHRVREYMTDRTSAVLSGLEKIARERDVTPAAVALAWAAAQETVASVLGGARTVEQLHDLMALTSVNLSDDEVRALTALADAE